MTLTVLPYKDDLWRSTFLFLICYRTVSAVSFSPGKEILDPAPHRQVSHTQLRNVDLTALLTKAEFLDLMNSGGISLVQLRLWGHKGWLYVLINLITIQNILNPILLLNYDGW